MEYESKFSYFEWKNELRDHFSWFVKRCAGIPYYLDEFISEYENEWLCLYSEFQEDERLRFCVLFSLIELEIEFNLLSPELREEFEIYNDEYNNGKLDELFKRNELECIDFDFNFCDAWLDKDYPKKDINCIKYFKLHTNIYDEEGAEKTFNEIPLYKSDEESIAMTMFAQMLLGRKISDDFNPGASEGYSAKKSEFFERCEHQSNNKSGKSNVIEMILNYRCKTYITENGMNRFVHMIFALLYQIQNNTVTDELKFTVKWMIEAFENENYWHLFEEDDIRLLKSDIDFIKESLFNDK